MCCNQVDKITAKTDYGKKLDRNYDNSKTGEE